MDASDLAGLSPRLLIDLIAIGVLAFGLSYRRHGRRDLVVLYGVFNIGLFAAVVVIGAGEIGAALGFGLFAVLSIIRLRSESLSNPDIAYFFAAIVIGLVTAVDLGDALVTTALAGLVLAAVALIDHPRLLPMTRDLEVMLEEALPGEAPLRTRLEERLGSRVVDVDVLEVDYVRETTRVAVRVATR